MDNSNKTTEKNANDTIEYPSLPVGTSACEHMEKIGIGSSVRPAAQFPDKLDVVYELKKQTNPQT
jgi:hypothetical protein